MKLTTRQYELLMFLLEQDDFVVISRIADTFSLSTRTVQREIKNISDYLGQDAELIETKAGKGIRFAGSSDERRRLMESIPNMPELIPAYAPEERISSILFMLLMDNGPRKILSFTSGLGVSEATVGNDLNICEKWLEEAGIRLVRKQGLGVYVDASEPQRRQAIIRLYHEISGDDTLELNEPLNISLRRNSIRRLFKPDIMARLEEILGSIPEMNVVNANDKLRCALVTHLYLIYLRVLQGAGITDAGEFKINAEESLASKIIESMEKKLKISIPEGERVYLATILSCTHGLSGISEEADECCARKLTSELIKKAEALTGVAMDQTGVFSEALVKHLIPTIQRIKLKMDIRNPMQEDIKQHYASLYELAKKCSGVIEDEVHMPLPDSEICYLALHLGVAIEDSRSYTSRRFRAVVCCPSGMVTARLLALRIGREFSNIEIVNVLPTTNIDYGALAERGVDVIISTVRLPETQIPNVYVSSFLKDDEKHMIWKVLEALKQNPLKKDEYEDYLEYLKEPE